MSTSSTGLKLQTAFTPHALAFKLPERAEKLGKQIENVVDYGTLPNPQENNYTRVPWGQGIVSAIGIDSSPYVECLTTSVAVLALGYPRGSSLPTHEAIHHYFFGLKNTLSQTLLQLADKVKNGTLEIFIVGSVNFLSDLHTEVKQQIENCKRELPDVTFKIVNDSFALADLGKLFKLVDKKIYPETSCLHCAGFNKSGEPFQVIGLTNHKPYAPEQVESFFWITHTL